MIGLSRNDYPIAGTALSKQEKIIRYAREKRKFRAADMAKDLNMTNAKAAGNFLRTLPEVRLKVRGGEWEWIGGE